MLPVDGKFVGVADGNSMASFDIPHHATFIADYLGPEDASSLVYGDIIVIDGPAEFSETGLRLRVFAQISQGEFTLLRDGFGRQPRTRPVSELRVKVTHVVHSDRLSNRQWAAKLIKSVREKLGMAA